MGHTLVRSSHSQGQKVLSCLCGEFCYTHTSSVLYQLFNLARLRLELEREHKRCCGMLYACLWYQVCGGCQAWLS